MRCSRLGAQDGVPVQVPLYVGNEDVRGCVHLRAAKGKKVDVDHNGVRVELIGQIEMFHDRGNTFSFISLEKYGAKGVKVGAVQLTVLGAGSWSPPGTWAPTPSGPLSSSRWRSSTRPSTGSM